MMPIHAQCDSLVTTTKPYRNSASKATLLEALKRFDYYFVIIQNASFLKKFLRTAALSTFVSKNHGKTLSIDLFSTCRLPSLWKAFAESQKRLRVETYFPHHLTIPPEWRRILENKRQQSGEIDASLVVNKLLLLIRYNLVNLVKVEKVAVGDDVLATGDDQTGQLVPVLNWPTVAHHYQGLGKLATAMQNTCNLVRACLDNDPPRVILELVQEPEMFVQGIALPMGEHAGKTILEYLQSRELYTSILFLVSRVPYDDFSWAVGAAKWYLEKHHKMTTHVAG